MTNPENDHYAELKAFLGEWFRPLEPGDGNTEEEIVAAETRLGFRLPEALRELYALVGKCDDLIGYMNPMIRLDDLEMTGDYLAFWGENQGVWQLVIDRRRDWTQHNPNTEFLFDGQREGVGEPMPLSQVALILVATELVNGRFSAFGNSTDEGNATLVARSSRIPHDVLNEYHFCYCDGALVWMQEIIQVAAPNEERLLKAVGAMKEVMWQEVLFKSV